MGLLSDWSQSHTGNSGKKNSKRWKNLRGLLWSACKSNTDFHPSSLPVKPVSLDRTFTSFGTGRVFERKLSCLLWKIIFLSPVYLRLSFQIFCSLFLSLGKRWTLVLFLFDLCFNCSFYPCGPWWLRTVILWWCSLGQQLVQMGVNWVRMKGK